MWCQWMAPVYESIIAIEADPTNAAVIEGLLLTNVKVVQAAGWVCSGHKMPFNCRQGGRDQEGGLACRDLLRGAGVSSQIDVTTLAIDDLGLPHCDMIVVDAEGVEIQVLQGATRTIEAHHPDLIIECHEVEHRAWLETWLGRAGYNVAIIHQPDYSPDHPVKHLVAEYYRSVGRL